MKVVFVWAALLRLSPLAACRASRRAGDPCLQAVQNVKQIADPLCSLYLEHANTVVPNLPVPLPSCLSSPSKISSLCSQLLGRTTSPATTTKPSTSATCNASTVTVTQTTTAPGTTSDTTDFISTTTTATTVSTTVTTVVETLIATSTTTAPGTTSDIIISTTATVTSVSTTVSVVTTTATTTVTAVRAVGAVDQNGCPAVDGYNFDSYIIHCNSGASVDSFAVGSRPGYNIEDCSSQCFDNPFNSDCLGTTYTPPSVPFNGIDGRLQPGTCTFYEFVGHSVPSPGVVLAVFQDSFAG